MTRFFIRPDQITGAEAVLDHDDAHHLRVVLKAKPGDPVGLLDGSGREFASSLIEVGKSHARARITGETVLDTECRTRITVAQALPKMAEKMEQVLQRGTEAGAAAFWAYSSARSLDHLAGNRQTKRIARWQQIVKTAAEQSHRAVLPAVRIDQSFADILRSAPDFDLALFAFEGELERTLRQALESTSTAPRTVLIIIGPEGGFTDQEAASARKSGLTSVSLGRRILRTETAALVMLSQIVYAVEG
jgi:16S rRNA (uracil1498-N3)-methyltransferase